MLPSYDVRAGAYPKDKNHIYISLSLIILNKTLCFLNCHYPYRSLITNLSLTILTYHFFIIISVY